MVTGASTGEPEPRMAGGGVGEGVALGVAADGFEVSVDSFSRDSCLTGVATGVGVGVGFRAVAVFVERRGVAFGFGFGLALLLAVDFGAGFGFDEVLAEDLALVAADLGRGEDAFGLLEGVGEPFFGEDFVVDEVFRGVVCADPRALRNALRVSSSESARTWRAAENRTPNVSRTIQIFRTRGA